jgi:hypothetical protein
MMTNYKPSDFARLGSPSCSRWGKSEFEWIALAYVQALANDGDEWKTLSREQVCSLLTLEQLSRCYEPQLTDDYYKDRFDIVAEQITDSDGALGVGGFWNEFRLAQGKPADEVKP